VVNVAAESFTEFARGALTKVRAGLIAGFGPELGSEATAEAMAYGWEHWDRLREMENPSGYLYRVGRTHAVRALRRQRRQLRAPSSDAREPVWVEPALEQVLRELPRRQRAAVSLIHGYGFSLQEVADLWGVSRSTVQAHVDRALRQLRARLGVDSAI
jgi:RNA polymerase sigma factor (sigma-70 family)